MTEDELLPLTKDTPPEVRAQLVAGNRQGSAGTLLERVGIEVEDVAYDRATASIPVAGNTQPFGLFHGGAHVVIAESLASLHSYFISGRPVVGVDLNATHVRAAKDGHVHATATLNHHGRTMINHEVRMTDDEGRLLSIVRITNMVLSGRS